VLYEISADLPAVFSGVARVVIHLIVHVVSELGILLRLGFLKP
jgi:hypothetical protein